MNNPFFEDCDIDEIFHFFVQKKMEEKKINEYRDLPLNKKIAQSILQWIRST